MTGTSTAALTAVAACTLNPGSLYHGLTYASLYSVAEARIAAAADADVFDVWGEKAARLDKFLDGEATLEAVPSMPTRIPSGKSGPTIVRAASMMASANRARFSREPPHLSSRRLK